MRQRTRGIAALVVGIACALIGVAVASGADGSAASKILAGDDVTIPAGTTIDHDVYAFGSTVEVDGTVHGDLVVAAARVTIAGTVTGDVLAAGSDVTVNGSVNGDVRVAAAQITVTGTVSEDVAVVAQSLLQGSSGKIGGDVLFTATEAELDGAVTGDIEGSATDYQRHGTVGGQEDVTLAVPANESSADRTLALALDALRQFILVMLFGLAMLRFAPGLFRAATERVRRQPMGAGVSGALVLVGVVGVLIAIFVVGLLLGLAFGELGFVAFVVLDLATTIVASAGILLALIVFSAFLADGVVGAAVGRIIAVPEQNRWGDVIRLTVGAALVVVVTSFPVVGSIVKLLVILVGLGAFAGVIWEGRRRPRPEPTMSTLGA